MNDMKEKALKLADELDKASGYLVCIGDANFKECADMIRKLVAELDNWEKNPHLQSHVLGFMEAITAERTDGTQRTLLVKGAHGLSRIFDRVFERALQTACESTRISQTADANTGFTKYVKQTLSTQSKYLLTADADVSYRAILQLLHFADQ